MARQLRGLDGRPNVLGGPDGELVALAEGVPPMPREEAIETLLLFMREHFAVDGCSVGQLLDKIRDLRAVKEASAVKTVCPSMLPVRFGVSLRSIARWNPTRLRVTQDRIGGDYRNRWFETPGEPVVRENALRGSTREAEEEEGDEQDDEPTDYVRPSSDEDPAAGLAEALGRMSASLSNVNALVDAGHNQIALSMRQLTDEVREAVAGDDKAVRSSFLELVLARVEDGQKEVKEANQTLTKLVTAYSDFSAHFVAAREEQRGEMSTLVELLAESETKPKAAVGAGSMDTEQIRASIVVGARDALQLHDERLARIEKKLDEVSAKAGEISTVLYAVRKLHDLKQDISAVSKSFDKPMKRIVGQVDKLAGEVLGPKGFRFKNMVALQNISAEVVVAIAISLGLDPRDVLSSKRVRVRSSEGEEISDDEDDESEFPSVPFHLHMVEGKDGNR